MGLGNNAISVNTINKLASLQDKIGQISETGSEPVNIVPAKTPEDLASAFSHVMNKFKDSLRQSKSCKTSTRLIELFDYLRESIQDYADYGTLRQLHIGYGVHVDALKNPIENLTDWQEGYEAGHRAAMAISKQTSKVDQSRLENIDLE